MTKKFKIFDIVIYDGDFDLLNLRIEEFSEIIDNIIIVPTSTEVKKKILSRNIEKIVVFEVFDTEEKFRQELEKFLVENYTSFDDLIFVSKENEIPDFNELDEILDESKYRIIYLDHKTLCWNSDYYSRTNSFGGFVFTFSKFLTTKVSLNLSIKNLTQRQDSNNDRALCGWKFLNFHEPTSDESFARENLLPSVNYDFKTTYKLEKIPNNFGLPKNIGILAKHKIGREYMKQHLFLVESDNDINFNEIGKIYDTISIIDFTDNSNEMIAENIGESVFKSILLLPNNVLYGEKPLKDFREDYKKNEIKRIIETVFPQDQDQIRIIYKGFDDSHGLWGTLKNQNFSEIINPS